MRTRSSQGFSAASLRAPHTFIANGRDQRVVARRSDVRETILRGLRVEAVDEGLAKIAGEALAAVREATTVDAVVMASAARRGDVVYTSDFDDLDRLRAYFRRSEC